MTHYDILDPLRCNMNFVMKFMNTINFQFLSSDNINYKLSDAEMPCFKPLWTLIKILFCRGNSYILRVWVQDSLYQRFRSHRKPSRAWKLCFVNLQGSKKKSTPLIQIWIFFWTSFWKQIIIRLCSPEPFDKNF